MKYFIITIDTEGDDLWSYKPGKNITTRNAGYIPRFQELCDKFSFKPVYLTNYEMANSDEFVNNAKVWLKENRCEIGVHLHAWNNPPFVDDNVTNSGQQYLIEYSEKIMREKFDSIYRLLEQRFGVKPVTHRAGRWAMDERYFHILKEYDLKVDCSFTPHMNWTRNMGGDRGGSDYTNVPEYAHSINGILEVPVSIKDSGIRESISWKGKIRLTLTGKKFPTKMIWLRPTYSSVDMMKKVIDMVKVDDMTDYAEFMIHSSEFMPGGSPYFKTEESIELLFASMEKVFEYAHSLGFVGCTLGEYQRLHSNL